MSIEPDWNVVADIIHQARLRLSGGRWMQGGMSSLGDGYETADPWQQANCSMCLLGAIQYATDRSDEGRFDDEKAAVMTVEQIIAKLYPERITGRLMRAIPSFNDHPDTTHKDVRGVLNLALALARSEASKQEKAA